MDHVPGLHHGRLIDLMRSAIERCNLDLSGLTVLTEAATARTCHAGHRGDGRRPAGPGGDPVDALRHRRRGSERHAGTGTPRGRRDRIGIDIVTAKARTCRAPTS